MLREQTNLLLSSYRSVLLDVFFRNQDALYSTEKPRAKVISNSQNKYGIGFSFDDLAQKNHSLSQVYNSCLN